MCQAVIDDTKHNDMVENGNNNFGVPLATCEQKSTMKTLGLELKTVKKAMTENKGQELEICKMLNGMMGRAIQAGLLLDGQKRRPLQQSQALLEAMENTQRALESEDKVGFRNHFYGVLFLAGHAPCST